MSLQLIETSPALIILAGIGPSRTCITALRAPDGVFVEGLAEIRWILFLFSDPADDKALWSQVAWLPAGSLLSTLKQLIEDDF
ncbi:hypothetical protein F442_12819 [Phytophthora nicotianae P10297]|uniref:Uncharacterized protein n=1 Tax=Phytophthora nicotianae P10297 TaxID=1317064 RepID=W2YY68_PHYNI|nr:hypothetical protein F442_12819 [Phytophthora nicotianae P10297]